MTKIKLHRVVVIVLLTSIILSLSILSAFSTDDKLSEITPVIPTSDHAIWADIPPIVTVRMSHLWWLSIIIPTGDEADQGDLPPALTPQ